MRTRRLLAATLAVSAVLALAAACGDDGDDNGAAPTLVPGVTPSPTGFIEPQTPEGGGTPFAGTIEPDLLAQIEAISDATEQVMEAFQSRDPEMLRAILAEGLRAQVQDTALQQLATCVPEGATVDIGVPLPRGTQRGTLIDVLVTVRITENGDERQAERHWLFQPTADGSLVLIELPDCPYE
jgi:hypothetical protein